MHAGVPLALCIPARYIHSHVSIIHRDDYENMVNLLVTVIKRLDRKTVEKSSMIEKAIAFFFREKLLKSKPIGGKISLKEAR